MLVNLRYDLQVRIPWILFSYALVVNCFGYPQLPRSNRINFCRQAEHTSRMVVNKFAEFIFVYRIEANHLSPNITDTQIKDYLEVIRGRWLDKIPGISATEMTIGESVFVMNALSCQGPLVEAMQREIAGVKS